MFLSVELLSTRRPMESSRFFRALARHLLAPALLFASLPVSRGQTPPAPPSAAPSATLVTASDTTMIGPIKFGDGMTVDSALEKLEEWTGRIALRPQALPATAITLNINRRVTKAEAVQALETVLALNGIAIAPLGDRFFKVTALAQARGEAPELIEGSTLGLPASGRVASKLFTFRFLRASEIIPQISALLNPGMGAAPIVVERANAALITDTLSNLQRIELLLGQLDRPTGEHAVPRFFTLTNAKATDVANSIRTLLAPPAGSQFSASTVVQADDRTNQIILICDPRQQEFFEQLITRLDSKGESNTRQEVIFIKHAVAADVAQLLTQLVSGRNTATGATAEQRSLRQLNQQARNLADALSSRRNAAQPAAGQSAAVQVAPVTVTAPAVESGEAITEFSSMLTILPEERSNAIVISGTVDDIRIIRELVANLDVLLAQVRIEVVIAEVNLTDNASTGMEELGFEVVADKLVGFSGALPGVAVTDGTVSAVRDLSYTLGLTTTPRKSNTTILSTPMIVTTHNKEGTIFVGEQRPVISSYINNNTGGGVSGGYSSTVSYRDIGIELKVKPLIGNDGALELEITQEVNDVLGEVIIDGNAQPRIGRRSTVSYVSVRSGEIVAFGGLQRKSEGKTTSRLGPIPILGDLFGKRTRENTRTDLVLFLRPYILTNTPADNEESLQRVDRNRNAAEVREALGQPGAPGR